MSEQGSSGAAGGAADGSSMSSYLGDDPLSPVLAAGAPVRRREAKKYKVVFVGDERVGKTSILSRFLNDEYAGRRYEPTIGIDCSTKTVVYEEANGTTAAAALEPENCDGRTYALDTSHNGEQKQQQQQQQQTEDNGQLQASSSSSRMLNYMQDSMTSVGSILMTPQELMAELLLEGKRACAVAHKGPPLPARLQIWDTAGKDRFRSMIPQYLRDCHVAVVVYDVTNRSSFESAPKWIRMAREEDEEEDDSQQPGNGQKKQVQQQQQQQRERQNRIVFLVAHKVDAPDGTRRVVSCEEGTRLAAQEWCVYVECSSSAGYNIRTLFRKIAAALYIHVIHR